MSYTLGDVQTSSKGIRSAAHRRIWQSRLHCCSGASIGAVWRVNIQRPRGDKENICFRCTPDIEAQFDAIDKYMESYVQENGQRLFKGKAMTYRPALQTKEDYAPLLRCKINMAGSKSCRFWTPMYSRCDAPPELKD